MRRVIRHRTTNQYLTKTGFWTSDLAAAEQHADAVAVQAAWLKHRPEDAEAVIMIGERPSSYDVVIPLPYLT